MPPSAPDYQQVLTLVRSWPAEQRFVLIQDLLTTLAPSVGPDRATQPTLNQARGLLKTHAAPPSDAEVAVWLDERRQARYGL